MRAAAISGAVIAALAAGAVATPTFAQPYRSYAYDSCERHSDGTAGAVIGGIAGAILGSNLAAHHGGRAGGAALGGVAGALIGNSIARSSSSCDTDRGYAYESRYSRPYDRRYGYAYDGRYSRPYDSRYGYAYDSRTYDYGYRPYYR